MDYVNAIMNKVFIDYFMPDQEISGKKEVKISINTCIIEYSSNYVFSVECTKKDFGLLDYSIVFNTKIKLYKKLVLIFNVKKKDIFCPNLFNKKLS